MFGLFDQFNTDDPSKQARLAQSLALLQAGGPSRVPVSLFQGLGMAGQAGLEAKRQAQKDAQAKLLQDMQLQQFTAQREDAQRRQAQEAAKQAAIESMNPMNAGPVPKPQMDAFTLLKAGMIPATEYMNMTKPKEPKYTTVDGRLVRTDTETPSVALDVGPRFDPNKPFNMVDGKMVPNPDYQQYAQTTAKAGAPSIVNKIDNKTGESIAAQVGPLVTSSMQGAQSGLKLVDSANRILDAAEKGNLYAGPLANVQLKAAQFGSALGIAGKDTEERIKNTRSVIRGMSEQAVAARSQLGGQAQISNSEQELLNKATAGDIGELTHAEVVQIANLNDRLGRQLYERHTQTMQTMQQRPDLQNVAPFYKVPDMPPPRKAASMSAQDKAALDWANANPGDPRAAQIKQRLKVK